MCEVDPRKFAPIRRRWSGYARLLLCMRRTLHNLIKCGQCGHVGVRESREFRCMPFVGMDGMLLYAIANQRPQ